MISYPCIIINCKNYGSTGVLAKDIAKAASVVLEKRKGEQKTDVSIALAVPATDVYRVAKLGLVPVLVEHLDFEGKGATTGHIIAEDVKENGAVGTLINHSEDPYSNEEIKETIYRAKECGLFTVVCAKDETVAKKVASFSPDCVAMEPPALIGGDISVSTAEPDLIKKTVSAVHSVADIPVLVGAGVKNKQDVAIASELGSKGILVASGVTKAKDFVAAIEDLANGFD